MLIAIVLVAIKPKKRPLLFILKIKKQMIIKVAKLSNTKPLNLNYK